MIEARATWTLEGPDDTITFSPTSEFVLTEKPRTAVDDRRDTYDYPLDDGSHIGDAYAGARLWTLKGLLNEDSHSARNVSMQRLTALLNSLRREDGLLKWQAEGFPAVQSTVRRAGSVDFSGGRSLHVPFTFGLISGDPRVYSQTEHTSSVGIGTPTYGSNLLSTNASGFETSVVDWSAPSLAYNPVTRSTAQFQAGSASLRVQRNSSTISGSIGAWTVTNPSVTPGTLYEVSAYIRPDFTGTAVVKPRFFDSGGTLISTSGTASAVTAGAWTQLSTIATAPDGAATMAVYVVALSPDYANSGEGIYVDTVVARTVTYSAGLTLDNDGDADTAPVYVITGPGVTPRITNNTTGVQFPLSLTVSSGTTVTVDAANREIYSGATLTESSNLYSTKAASNPFPLLEPGSNAVVFSAASGTSGATELDVYWRDAWMP